MIAKFEEIDGISHIQMDDGKANAIGFAMLDSLNSAFDQADAHGGPVVLSGRENVFCGGFDLKVMRGDNPAEKARLIEAGGDLIVRMLQHSAPIVGVTQGHSIALGFFITLACDLRIGAKGDYKYWANETTIGLTLPVFAYELGAARLNLGDQMNALALANAYSPEAAQRAGIINELVEPDAALTAAVQRAKAMSEFPKQALANNKAALNQRVIAAIRDAETGLQQRAVAS